MSTMNISLPDALKSFVDEQVNLGSYGTSSEYVRELIAGATSAPTKPTDAAYFNGLRDRVRQASKAGASK
jgi:antitoxin ParD1/3/4